MYEGPETLLSDVAKAAPPRIEPLPEALLHLVLQINSTNICQTYEGLTKMKNLAYCCSSIERAKLSHCTSVWARVD